MPLRERRTSDFCVSGKIFQQPSVGVPQHYMDVMMFGDGTSGSMIIRVG